MNLMLGLCHICAHVNNTHSHRTSLIQGFFCPLQMVTVVKVRIAVLMMVVVEIMTMETVS